MLNVNAFPVIALVANKHPCRNRSARALPSQAMGVIFAPLPRRLSVASLPNRSGPFQTSIRVSHRLNCKPLAQVEARVSFDLGALVMTVTQAARMSLFPASYDHTYELSAQRTSCLLYTSDAADDLLC